MADPHNCKTSTASSSITIVELILAIIGNNALKVGASYAASKLNENAHRLGWSNGRRLLWEDLPAGPLHVCSSTVILDGLHKRCDTFERAHQPGTECWEIIGQIFNCAWGAPEVLVDKIPKVKGLSMTDYLETDMKTLLAYVACGVDSHAMSVYISSCWSIPDKYDARFFDTDNTTFFLRAHNIEMKFERLPKADGQRKGHLAAHVTGSFDHILPLDSTYGFPLQESQALRPISLSKDDMEHILDGFPPYYRSKYILYHNLPTGTHKITLQDPIPEPRAIIKGGWIIAVGRTYTYPVAFYVDSQGHNPGTSFPPLIGHSLKRAQQILREDIAPEFIYGDQFYPDVCAAVNAVKMLLDGKSRSDLNRYWPRRGGSQGSIASLDETVSNDLITLFNRLGPLNARERQFVKDHTMAILEVIIEGIAIVIEYLKDRAAWLPKWWLNRLGDESIYLTGCPKGVAVPT